MLESEVLICGECASWVNGKCLKTGSPDNEPEEMGFGELACEEFDEQL